VFLHTDGYFCRDAAYFWRICLQSPSLTSTLRATIEPLTCGMNTSGLQFGSA